MEDVIARFENVLLIYHEPHAETLAIKDISIDFGRGNFTAIVGPSGCGKTTLLSMLAGASAVRALRQAATPATCCKGTISWIGVLSRITYCWGLRSSTC